GSAPESASRSRMTSDSLPMRPSQPSREAHEVPLHPVVMDHAGLNRWVEEDVADVIVRDDRRRMGCRHERPAPCEGVG
ncbi:MAG: hypothetical protein FWJ90_23540, partial [Actinomadura sp.]